MKDCKHLSGPAGSPTLLDVRPISEASDLEPFAAAWDALAARQPACIPMFAHSWVSMLFTIRLEDGERPLTLIALDGDELVGVMPLLLRDLRVCGMRRVSARIPAEYQSANGDVLVEPSRAKEVFVALLSGLRRHVPRLHRLEVGSVRDDAATSAEWASGAPGFRSIGRPDGTGSRVPHGDVEAWQAGLSKGLLRDLKRGRNKLGREDVDAVFAFEDPSTADPAFFDTFAELEASGWKGKEGTAILSYPENEAKHRYLLERHAQRGWLEWHTLRLAGELAAAHWVVRTGRSAMLLKQAFHEAWSKHHAGHLLLHAAIEREHGMAAAREPETTRSTTSEFNLVTDWPWCRRWGMDVRSYRAYTLHPRSLIATVCGVWPAKAKALAKRVLRRGPSETQAGGD